MPPCFWGTLCMLGCFNINWLAYRLQNHQSNQDLKERSYHVDIELQNKKYAMEVAPVEMA